MEERMTDKLARYIIILASAALVCVVCWYFRNVLTYIVLAAVLSIVGRPLFNLIKKIHVKDHRVPDWLASILTILIIFALLIALFTTIIPVVANVIRDISMANVENITQAASIPLRAFNRMLSDTFTNLGPNFRIEEVIVSQLKGIFDMSLVSSMVGSVTSFVAKLGITVFSMAFISFFFIRNPKLVESILLALVPDKYEDKVVESLGEIGNLISRYFIGLMIQIFEVSLINFLGLWLIARMGFRYSVGIAFIAGLLNIIPYLGPFLGGAIGVVLSLVIKYICATSFGLSVGFLPFVVILIAIFSVTQLIDNYIFQPLIFASNLNVHPLEIFIVMLMAGQVGGMMGMLCAIPAYMVVRVIAKQFFNNIKAIGRLTSEDKS